MAGHNSEIVYFYLDRFLLNNILMAFQKEHGVIRNDRISPWLKKQGCKFLSLDNTREGEYDWHVYFENEETNLEELRNKLRARTGRNHTLIIKTDRHAPFEKLAAVMNISLGLGYPTVIATSEDK